MKRAFKLLLLPIAILILTSSSYSDSYCEGFYNGFKNGYCHNQGSAYCIAPPPPICPMPKVNEDTYTHGYNRGFLVGLNY